MTKDKQKNRLYCKNYRNKYPIRHLLGRIKSRCRKQNIPFNLEEKDLICPEFCPVLGIKLVESNELNDNHPEIDRIIPELGYIKGNINIISRRANRIKNDGTITEHQLIIKYMKDNNISNI